MGWGLQPPLAASATRASSLIAGPEPAQFLSLLLSPSTLVYNKTKLSFYILDPDPQPSAALKALPVSARKTLRVSPRRCGDTRCKRVAGLSARSGLVAAHPLKHLLVIARCRGQSLRRRPTPSA